MNTQLINTGLQQAPNLANATTAGASGATTEMDENTDNSEAPTANASGEEWRNKENDRAARQHIARIILSLIMKSANRPVTSNYNPREIARRLEHTLYMNSSSKEEYSNLTTLKVRLQRALDNSRRRQQQAQQQQLQTAANASATTEATNATTAGTPAATTPATAAAAATPNPVTNSVATPANTSTTSASTTATAIAKQTPSAVSPAVAAAQAAQMKAAQTQAMQNQLQLQQAQFQAQMQLLSKTQPQPAAAPTPSTNILEELEREADEMASGISDQPLEMPTSELEASVSTTTNMPLNMPMNMSMPMGMMQNRVPYGMNLNLLNVNASAPYLNPQLQLQQIQQMQMQQLQLQKLQQIQQLQHQMQLNAAAKMNSAAAPTTSIPPGTSLPTTTTTNPPMPGAGAIPEVTPKQRREEFRKRLIQLKHARTCQNNPCEEGFCAKVKVLLTHVSNCSDAECTTIGCKSTRQLLSHYRKCRDMQCYVCSAIRTQNPASQAYVLRRQQDRLCMLRHASTCTLSVCPMTYCVDMKILWKHICECRQSQCTTDHCISSRYVLSHFKQCQKPDCGVCVPVRHAIKIIDSTKNNPQELLTVAQSCSNEVKILIRQMTTVPIAMPTQPVVGQPVPAQPDSKPMNMLTQQTMVKPDPQLAAQAIPPSVKTPAKPKQAKPKTPLTAMPTPMPAVKPSGVKTEPKLNIKKEIPAMPVPTQQALQKKPPTDKEKKEIRKMKAEKAKERQQSKMQGTVKPATAVATLGGTIKMEPEFKIPTVMPASSPTSTMNNEQDISYLDSMTEAQLDEHIKSLRFNFCGHISLVELKNRLMPLLTSLMETENGWVFNSPVDPVQWNIPDYLEVIKCPMDLGTIKKRLESEHYVSVESFASDVRLTFENCIAYNSSTHKFNIAAKELLAKFEKDLSELKVQLESELKSRCEQRREEMCQLCGGDSFKFAPCMLFCSGPCAGRIRRHTHYYSDPRGEYHWCSSCFKQMKDGPLDMSLLPASTNAATGDPPLTKAMLLKKKNSEVAEEPWVACDTCKLWYHQICGLFNERNHAISGEQEQFVCPFCTIKARQAGQLPSSNYPLQAKRLPKTRMAERIEKRVIDALAKAHQEELSRLGSLGNIEVDGSSALHPKSNTPPPSFAITIREVLSVDKQVQIKQRMAKQFAAKETAKATDSNSVKRGKNGVPEAVKKVKTEEKGVVKKEKKDKFELTYRSRCICVFQELDGVDVLIFTLYVQEYGDTCAEPNRGRVYISYLDSVAYFQPKKFRVLMHQHVIVGFLEDAKMRGYHTAHIWSCPPLKGDDYIFFCKPENQKIPKAARLRSWYSKLLQGAKKEGLVYTISNLYAEYYMKRKTALELPYFEGDYWPRLAEDLIKQVEEKSKSSSKSTHRKALDTTEPEAQEVPPPTEPAPLDLAGQPNKQAKNKGEINSDPIMQKLKAILEPQKEDFFVVDLHPHCHKCGTSIINRPYWTLKTLTPPDGVNEVIETLKKAKTAAIKSSMMPRHYHHYYCAQCYESSKNTLQSRVALSLEGAKKAQAIYEAVQASGDPSSFTYSPQDVQEVKYELNLTYSASSLLLEGETEMKELEPDTDELMPCEIFDTREAFLMYCQNNHCQFDQIRRSKHSSMMVLYHLFNQGTTGFTFSCHKCGITLTSGKRWNCSICLNFNLCEPCRGKTKHEHPLHAFQIVSIPQPKHKTSAEIDQHNMEASLLEASAANNKKNAKKRPGPKRGKGKGGNQIKKFKPDVSPEPETTPAHSSPVQQPPAAATAPSPAAPSASPAAAPPTATPGAQAAATPAQATPGANQQRIHNVDPQLLVQLEHASLCKLSEACTYTNCNRMRAMLKHGATCEARKVGPCQLCKRIVGLLSAHAKQCTKPIGECLVPRCTEIRRLVEQQQQKQQLLQQQQQQQ
ncbi:hypothetical protein LEN26_001466 [Aphanomyces euteiches]|nr:hypothetical protein LEN26_014046 [Aphanomyces euteiches]KAH9119063.1 hypothetical protein LEN26_011812 [Aphanomyces euteiches]KAH9161316.1 hypothetical protein LEN26_001466 [Aphanomyces euteiches]